MVEESIEDAASADVTLERHSSTAETIPALGMRVVVAETTLYITT